MRTPRPPLEYLVTSSRATIESFELTRLNQIANLRKELQGVLDEWVESEVEAQLARWMLQQRRERDNHRQIIMTALVETTRADMKLSSGLPARSVPAAWISDTGITDAFVLGRFTTLPAWNDLKTPKEMSSINRGMTMQLDLFSGRSPGLANRSSQAPALGAFGAFELAAAREDMSSVLSIAGDAPLRAWPTLRDVIGGSPTIAGSVIAPAEALSFAQIRVSAGCARRLCGVPSAPAAAPSSLQNRHELPSEHRVLVMRLHRSNEQIGSSDDRIINSTEAVAHHPPQAEHENVRSASGFLSCAVRAGPISASGSEKCSNEVSRLADVGLNQFSVGCATVCREFARECIPIDPSPSARLGKELSDCGVLPIALKSRDRESGRWGASNSGVPRCIRGVLLPTAA